MGRAWAYLGDGCPQQPATATGQLCPASALHTSSCENHVSPQLLGRPAALPEHVASQKGWRWARSWHARLCPGVRTGPFRPLPATPAALWSDDGGPPSAPSAAVAVARPLSLQLSRRQRAGLPARRGAGQELALPVDVAAACAPVSACAHRTALRGGPQLLCVHDARPARVGCPPHAAVRSVPLVPHDVHGLAQRAPYESLRPAPVHVARVAQRHCGQHNAAAALRAKGAADRSPLRKDGTRRCCNPAEGLFHLLVRIVAALFLRAPTPGSSRDPTRPPARIRTSAQWGMGSANKQKRSAHNARGDQRAEAEPAAYIMYM